MRPMRRMSIKTKPEKEYPIMKKIVFSGLRHEHINLLYLNAAKSPELEIAAICEENPDALQAFLAAHPENQAPVYSSLDKMLAEVPCDIVATGDYYGKRGKVLIQAMKAGKHVISDKPLCTTPAELDEIEKLARENHLSVGCMLDLRTNDSFMQARKMILAGEIGKVVQIQFGGQHPLMLGVRPHWYFEPGKHGGTLNDIAIHAIDCIPWITGLEIKTFMAARTWQAFDSGCDFFNDAAQFMMVMDNGCGVLGDVSYSEPDSHGYKMPQYWRFTVWGTKGVLEFNSSEKKVCAWIQGETEMRTIVPAPYTGPQYIDWFLQEIDGKEAALNTSLVLKRARQTLELQRMADGSK